MIFPNLTLFDKFTLDTETTGLNWRHDKIFGFSISTPDGEDYYWDVREEPKALLWLDNELKGFRGDLINHNLKYDIHFLREAGINVLNGKYPGINWDCTMIRAALIDEHRFTYNLDDVAKDYIGLGKIDPYQELADMFGGKPTRHAQLKNLHLAPRSLVDPYAKRDTRATLELWEAQEKIINKVNMHQVCGLERDVMYPVQDMERRGVRVDIDAAEQKVYELDRIVDRERTELDKIAGFPINPNPSGSIHRLFNPKQNKHGTWIACDGTHLGSTKKGKASIDAEALRNMKHPAAEKILTVRQLMKCRDTFIQGHILNSEENGRVYPNINQCKSDAGGTVTGRLSITKPPLQAIPKRDKKTASMVRPLFIPEEGQQWYRADYSQADARGFTHYTQSPPLLAAYEKDPRTDFHGLVASLTNLPRSAPYSGGANAKQLGLGLLFSMGEGRMACEMGLPYTTEVRGKREWLKPGPEATEIFTNFHIQIPGVKEFSKKATSVAKTRGYIISLMGRHMHFPHGHYAYKAAGYLFQSATAEFNKVKMVDTYNMIENTDTEILLSVHDELNFSSNDPDLMEEVQEEMEDFHSDHARIKLRVPMVADMKSGNNWWEAN